MTDPAWFDRADLLRRIEERRDDPEFMERLRSIVEDNKEALDQLSLGPDPQERIVFDHVTGEVRWESY